MTALNELPAQGAQGFCFDFSHGAKLPVSDPRGRDVSERVNIHIDAAFLAKRLAEPRREYVGASSIGGECLRAIQLGYAGVPIDAGRMEGKVLRIFQVGHVFEDEVARWLIAAGFDLEVVNPETGKQWGFSVLGGKGKGHLDGIVRGGPIPMEYPAMWECKALNDKGWQEVKKKGLAIAKPTYAAQVALDQAYLGLKNPALFTMLNKNTEELHHELIEFDPGLAQQMSDRMAQVVTATARQELLPRAFNAPTHFKCSWCDFNKSCWSMKR